jgi:signal peptidase I
MKINKNIIIENIQTIFYALVIAIVIRSLLIQPFYIPSSSMEPTLLVGDRLFVTNIHTDIASIHFLLVHLLLRVEYFQIYQKLAM